VYISISLGADPALNVYAHWLTRICAEYAVDWEIGGEWDIMLRMRKNGVGSVEVSGGRGYRSSKFAKVAFDLCHDL
jgi:hypothetical protein